MKRTINYICGHTGEITDQGGRPIHDKFANYLATRLCPACNAEKLQRARPEMSVVPLRGTDKQVAWATEIRYTKIDDLWRFANDLCQYIHDTGDKVLAGIASAIRRDCRDPFNYEILSDWIQDNCPNEDVPEDLARPLRFLALSDGEEIPYHAIPVAVAKLLGKDSAEWWIDHRDWSFADMVRKEAEGI